MIDWWNARQDGVRKARQDAGEHGVTVARGRGQLPAKGPGRQGDGDQRRHPLHPSRPLLLFHLETGFTPDGLVRALDYLEARLPADERFGRRNVYLGEYGVGRARALPEGERPWSASGS